jgi:nucleotide-binding universal stress UspA family protein
VLEIRNVLAPVDFTPATARELAVAQEICQLFGARLVLHHNRNAAPPGFSRAWDWSETQHQKGRPPAERQLRELLATLPEGLAAEARLSDGQVVPALLHLARHLPADLMVLASHGCSTEDHASVAERVIASPPCPVLTLHGCEENEGQPRPLFQRTRPPVLLVPVDFSPAAQRAAELTYDLARAVSSRVHLLHVVEASAGPGEPVIGDTPAPFEASAAELEAAAQLGDGVPEDLADAVGVHLARGEVSAAILAAARELDASLIVMGEHTRSIFQRWLTRDTAQELLHRAPCPVLYVPTERR